MNTGILYWITGLSGSGKTTIGQALHDKLSENNGNIVFLDGDDMKLVFESTHDIDYSADARRQRALKYSKLCSLLVSQGLIVVCSTISMFDEVRELNRKSNTNYVEIFLRVKLETLKQRDQKGLYTKLSRGEAVSLAGFNVEAEFPKNPDIIIENDGILTVDECINIITSYKLER